MFRRVGLFLLTNFAILMVLGVVMIAIQAFLPPEVDFGLGQYFPLLLFSAIFGFGGSFISLLISKWMAKRATGARVITAAQNQQEAWLMQTVQNQARHVGIGMPEVAIYESGEVNAFATSASKNSSLVAVSRGLLNGMTAEEVEAVLAHEISHIANGDMVTLTLIQGTLNTFVYFGAAVIGHAADAAISRGSRRRGSGPMYFLTRWIAQIVLGILATIIVRWFSRQREYRADAGAAAIVGPQKMIAALTRLKQQSEPQLPANMEAMGISGKASALFSTHPKLDDRIAALMGQRG